MHERGFGAPAARDAVTGLGAVLQEIRAARRISQAQLAEIAECDHSCISRLEGGTRGTTRELLERMALNLGLDAAMTDRLVLAGGFAPDSYLSLDREPDVRAALETLLDPDLPDGHRTLMRHTLRLLTSAGQEAARMAAREKSPAAA